MSLLHRKLWRDMTKLRGQIATIALVVAAAVGGFVGCLSTSRSLESARDAYYAQARFAQLFAPLTRAPRSLLPRLEAVPGVLGVEVSVRWTAQLTLPGVARPLAAQLVGLPAAGQRLDRMYLRRGRLPAAAREAVVDEGFAIARGVGPGDTVEVLLNGRRERYALVGVGLAPEFVFASAGGVIADPLSFAVLWVEEEPLAAAVDLRDAFNHAAFLLAPGASEPRVAAALDAVLARYGSRVPYGRDEQGSHQALQQELGEQRVIGTVLPGVFLWVVGFLLHVVLGRHVATQREQIAALKALGFDDGPILRHYLGFVAVTISVGVLAGVGVGAWFGHRMTGMYLEYFHFPSAPYRLGVVEIVVAAAASYATGLAGAWRAVRDAVRIPPAQAMHAPAPARYRPLLLERLRAAGWMSPTTRMIARNLERRPARAVLATVGIGGSAALVVAGSFWWDAIEYLIAEQFGRANRADAIVAMDRPVHADAVREALRWPGVLEAEGARTVPALLRAGTRERRIAIGGVPTQPRLRRIVDADSRVVPVPPGQLVLGTILADRLGVQAGDRVRVEVLDGARGGADLRVARIADELFGYTAYLDIAALNRLAGQGPTVDTIALRQSAGERASLYARLRDTPRAGTLVEPAELAAGFRATAGRNVLVFTTIVAGFAAAVAFGVVYNNLRVALAERAWELASLRVLGFSRAEVSTMLIGEMAIVLTAAVPVGLLLGRALASALCALLHGETFRIPVVIEPRTYLLGAAVTIVAGIASALLVRRRIDSLDLVAVLKVRE